MVMYRISPDAKLFSRQFCCNQKNAWTKVSRFALKPARNFVKFCRFEASSTSSCTATHGFKFSEASKQIKELNLTPPSFLIRVELCTKNDVASGQIPCTQPYSETAAPVTSCPDQFRMFSRSSTTVSKDFWLQLQRILTWLLDNKFGSWTEAPILQRLKCEKVLDCWYFLRTLKSVRRFAQYAMRKFAYFLSALRGAVEAGSGPKNIPRGCSSSKKVKRSVFET